MNDSNDMQTMNYAAKGAAPDSIWEMTRRNPSAVTVIGTVALFALTLFAYASAMRGDFVWDDDYYVTENPALHTLTGLQDIWFKPGTTVQYYPLTFTTFWIEYRLWGLNPLGYHVVNVVLHATGAALLWVLLRRLKVPGAWAAAAIFAVHPVHVESVAWITERKNVLSGVFFFSTLLVYLRYCGITPAPQPTADAAAERQWLKLPDDPTRVYSLVVLLFACALLSKSVTFSLPAVVLVIMWWKRGRISWDDVVPLLPLFAMGILMGWVTSHIERTNVGAYGPAFDYAPTLFGELVHRTLIAGRAIWFYVGKLLLPYPLIFNYPRWNISTAVWWQFLFPAGALAALLALWSLRNRIGRGALAAGLVYVGMLFPALGYINVFPMQYSFVADHFVYLPSAALIALFAAGCAVVIDRLVRSEVLFPVAGPAGTVLLLAVLVFASFRQGMVYRDMPALWVDTLQKTGHKSWMAANNYGVWLLEQGMKAPRGTPARAKYLDAAEEWFGKTIRLKSDHDQARLNLGLIELSRGNEDKALGLFREAARLEPRQPRAHFKIGELLARKGDRDGAIESFKQVVKLQPRGGSLAFAAHFSLGEIYDRLGQPREAAAAYYAALQIDPESVPAHTNLGNALMALGDIPNAVREYAEVVRLDPQNARVRNNFGRLCAMMGKLVEAEAQFKLAIEYAPRFAEAHNNLGQVFVMTGRYDEGIEQFRKALELVPAFERAQKNLEDALGRKADPTSRPVTTFPATTQP